MTLDGGTAVVNVIANGAKLSSSIASATQQGVSRSTGALSSAGAKLTTLLTNPLVLAGGLAAKLAFDFEDAFAKISAVSNASAKDIEAWRGQVLQLSGATAQAPKELADALFFLASAGLKAGQPMQVLEASAKASAVGLGETADVARLTANVLNAYAKSGITAAQVTDTLVAAVREGTANTDEFTQAIGRVLPIAARAGVGFDQIVGSLAALSNIGLDVNEGVTALRGLLQSIVAPTTQTQNALHDLNITTDQLRLTLTNQGLPGALNLLEKASGGNIDVLRQLIPNVRALTGELGLTGENADKVALIMLATANSAGSLNKAFAETTKGPAFQFREALNKLVVVGTEIGIAVLPVIVDALKIIAPILALAGKAAAGLLIAFVGFKVLTALPAIFLGIATALDALGVAAATDAVLGLAAGFEAMAAAAGPVALAIGAVALVIATTSGIIKQATDTLDGWVTHLADFVQAQELAARTGMTFAAALALIEKTAKEAAAPTNALSPIIDNLNTHLDKTGQAARNFAGLTKKALGEFHQAVVDSVQVTIGQFKKLGDAFSTTPAELAKQAALAVQIARTEHRDLAAIFGSKTLSDKAKQALASLPADQRHAFAEGGKAAREQITKDALTLQRLNTQNFHQITTDATKQLKTGGASAGKGLADGVGSGINSGSGAVVARAHQLGLDTIAALKAALAIKSPSGEGIKIGRSFTDGFTIGMQGGFSKITDSLRTLVPMIQKALGTGASDQARAFLRDLGALEKQFSRLQSKINSFRSAVKSGFDSFKDLTGSIASQLADFAAQQQQFLADQAAFTADQGGTLTQPIAPTAPDIHAIIAQQVAAAKQFADVLKALQKAGLSAGNLSQLAAQGPAGLPEAQALLADPALIDQLNDAQKEIAQITQTTADKLTAAAFGDKVEKLSAQFDKLVGRLQAFIDSIPVPQLKDETKAFIEALQHMTNVLQNFGANAGGNSGGGGNGGGGGTGGTGGTSARAPLGSAGATTIVVNVNAGALVHQNDLPAFIRDQLLDLQRRNITTGL